MLSPVQILELLGVNATLIPIKRGTKGASLKWKDLTFTKTQVPTFQQRLMSGSAIAVKLGHASDNICTIDFDIDDAHDEFMKLNPLLSGTLKTKGLRGCNIWLKLTGDYPPLKHLKREGDLFREIEPVGEWRGLGNNYTIISGEHKSGCQYRVVVEGKPVELEWSQINWPDNWSPFGSGFGGSGSEEVGGIGDEETSRPPFVSPPLSVDSKNSMHSMDSILSMVSMLSMTHPPITLMERDLHAQKARDELALDVPLSKLHNAYLEKIYAKQGARNETLIKITTFLFHAVGRNRLLQLVAAFHQTNHDIFTDSLTQHMTEALAHLSSLDESYVTQLTATAAAIAEELPSRHLEIFRICRDLAIEDRKESPAGTFFMSSQSLGDRVSIQATQARRFLEVLISAGALEVLTKGESYQKGKRPQATLYRWLVD